MMTQGVEPQHKVLLAQCVLLIMPTVLTYLSLLSQLYEACAKNAQHILTTSIFIRPFISGQIFHGILTKSSLPGHAPHLVLIISPKQTPIDK